MPFLNGAMDGADVERPVGVQTKALENNECTHRDKDDSGNDRKPHTQSRNRRSMCRPLLILEERAVIAWRCER